MITVIDYGMGNLRSVSKAIEHLGGKVRISSSASDIASSDKVILPGVGAFGDAMHELRNRNLIEPIRDFVKLKKPFLGICLGLQLLFDGSEESKGVAGLGVWKGAVRRFQTKTEKVPHMGWNTVTWKREHPLIKSVRQPSYFYFVHSYYAAPVQDELILGSCRYGEYDFPAVMASDHVFATQFHPEKSQEAGLQILKNFIAL